VAHPRTNGQVERANGMILQGLKPRIYNRLKKFGKKWVEDKDGNGAPIPDSPWEIPLLGDGDGSKLIPTGI